MGHAKWNVAEALLHIDDIDDVRNGLLLFKPIEKAFDKFNISFIYNRRDDAFVLKVFNPDIRNRLLIQDLEYPTQLNALDSTLRLPDIRNLAASQVATLLGVPDWEHSRGCKYLSEAPDFNALTTYGDLEGQALVFLSIGRPYSRCLNVQARLAHQIALEQGWVDQEYDFADFWSEEMTGAERVALMFRDS
jgi:hypothetical protein